jgi:hypothetical protein
MLLTEGFGVDVDLAGGQGILMSAHGPLLK